MGTTEDLAKVIEHASLIATAAHFGQFRRDGVTPYITHPEAVAAAVEDRLKPIAWLHDVLEDTQLDAGCLHRFGLPLYVVSTVGILTNNWVNYGRYIEVVRENKDAATVKLADMRHNLSCQPSQHSIEKSKWAIPMLEEALK